MYPSLHDKVIVQISMIWWIKFYSRDKSLKGRFSTSLKKIIEIQICFKVMKKSLNFGSVAHGKIIKFLTSHRIGQIHWQIFKLDVPNRVIWIILSLSVSSQFMIRSLPGSDHKLWADRKWYNHSYQQTKVHLIFTLDFESKLFRLMPEFLPDMSTISQVFLPHLRSEAHENLKLVVCYQCVVSTT